MESLKQVIQFMSTQHEINGYDSEEPDYFEISLDLAKNFTFMDLVPISIYYQRFILSEEFNKIICPGDGIITIKKDIENPEIMCLLYMLLSGIVHNVVIRYDTGEDVFNPEYIQECWNYLVEIDILSALIGKILISIKSHYEEHSREMFINHYIGKNPVKSARNL